MEIFCIIYYITSYIAAIPAIIKIIRTKSSNDYSLIETALSCIGISSWTIYIFCTKQSLAVYVGTIIDFLMSITLYVSILRFYKFKKK